jgi:choline dehydrogenase-like flavoprotein
LPLFGAIADIVFTQPGLDVAFDFVRDASGRYVRRRMTLTGEVQSALGLLNAAAWPEPPPIADPRHGSGILSMAALALAAPVLGPRLSPEAIRRRKLGPGPLRPLPHLGNVARDVVGASRFAAGFLKARYLDPVRLPGFFVPNPGRRYDLHVHAEHAPDPESRVRLTDRRDHHGMPMLHVDLRYGEGDARSAVRTIDELGARLAAAGIARIEHRHPPDQRVAALLAQASDGFHQIGTARMSDDPRTGVVDGFGRVHGFSNLHLAGSAVFPSSGQANPTFLAVCLGLRLARHIAGAWRALPEPMAAE